MYMYVCMYVCTCRWHGKKMLRGRDTVLTNFLNILPLPTNLGPQRLVEEPILRLWFFRMLYHWHHCWGTQVQPLVNMVKPTWQTIHLFAQNNPQSQVFSRFKPYYYHITHMALPYLLGWPSQTIPPLDPRKRLCPAFGHRCELCSHENHYEFMCGAKAKKAKEAKAKEASGVGGCGHPWLPTYHDGGVIQHYTTNH